MDFELKFYYLIIKKTFFYRKNTKGTMGARSNEVGGGEVCFLLHKT